MHFLLHKFSKKYIVRKREIQQFVVFLFFTHAASKADLILFVEMDKKKD